MDLTLKSGDKRGEDVHGCRGPGGLSETLQASYRSRYKECVRMLNGLEKSLEKRLP